MTIYSFTARWSHGMFIPLMPKKLMVTSVKCHARSNAHKSQKFETPTFLRFFLSVKFIVCYMSTSIGVPRIYCINLL